jgi:putative nucleotidyltransferase with HDIG domain
MVLDWEGKSGFMSISQGKYNNFIDCKSVRKGSAVPTSALNVNMMPNKFTPYEIKQRTQTLSVIIWILMIASLILGILNIQYQTWGSVLALFGLSIFCAPLLWMNKKGYIGVSAFFLNFIVLMVININMWDGDGIRDAGLLAYPIFIMIGILFFGKRTAPLFTLASIASLIVLVYFEIQGSIKPTIGATKFDILTPIIILLIAAAAITYIVAGNIDKHLEQVKNSESELRKNYDLTLDAWAKVLEFRDNETEGHSRRLVELSTQLARALNLSEEEVTYIRRGALLHDIGKLAIPDSILLKPGPLAADERKIMEEHPVIAKQMLAQVSFLQPSIDLVYSHHERWDGKGYPDRLMGAQIPLSARIFAIVDQWDALRSDRPYRKAWPVEKVLAYIRDNVGVVYDPDLVKVFLPLVIE